MSPAISDLGLLLRSMAPALNPGVYVFATLPPDTSLEPQAMVACIREAEGWSVVMAEADAVARGVPFAFRAAWITLTVSSDLAAVGLTAAFAAALGRAGISCNVVAGTCHDHLFVPYEQAHAAMQALLDLQRESREMD